MSFLRNWWLASARASVAYARSRYPTCRNNASSARSSFPPALADFLSTSLITHNATLARPSPHPRCFARNAINLNRKRRETVLLILYLKTLTHSKVTPAKADINAMSFLDVTAKTDLVLARSGYLPGSQVEPESKLTSEIDGLTEDEIDGLPFGAIQLDTSGKILKYNMFEAGMAGLEHVVFQDLAAGVQLDRAERKTVNLIFSEAINFTGEFAFWFNLGAGKIT